MDKDEALKLALEALENAIAVRHGKDGTKFVDPLEPNAIAAIKKALAQPPLSVQKTPFPITGWKVEVRGSNQRLFVSGIYGDTVFVDLPLYTTPPKREWVGLTQKEVQEIHDTYYKRMGPQEFASMIEAKLKEKNNG